ncbi:MAG: hypothetical protein U0528_16110 [Anaerolineae bacterium]
MELIGDAALSSGGRGGIGLIRDLVGSRSPDGCGSTANMEPSKRIEALVGESEIENWRRR